MRVAGGVGRVSASRGIDWTRQEEEDASQQPNLPQERPHRDRGHDHREMVLRDVNDIQK